VEGGFSEVHIQNPAYPRSDQGSWVPLRHCGAQKSTLDIGVLDRYAGSCYIVGPSLVGYDGAQNVKGEERRVDDQQQSRWRLSRRQVLWASGIVASLTVAVLIGYRYGITLWDWIKILIVPAAIAIGVAWLNQAQRAGELEVENQRAQDSVLEAYLDQMSQLLLDKDRPLGHPRKGDEVRTLARARTLTVLRRLDGERKGRVVQFLHEAGLIAKDRPVLVLIGADLSGVRLNYTYLDKTYLSGANLSGTSLRGADLSGANLNGASLTFANLSNTVLSGAHLRDTDLSSADLIKADLREVNFHGLDTPAARPIVANPAEPTGTILIGANLSGADLSRAVLSGADLTGADFGEANLAGVTFSGANLSQTNFERATGIIEEELAQHALSLEGTIMPDGQRYEEWLKDRESRAEDGDNSGP
jgi:uncharacterized protein YjbI with pentapeptide repeats